MRDGVTQDPWLALGGAADHDAVCAGDIQSAVGVLGAVYIAIDDYRNVYSVFYGADGMPIGLAFIHLATCAAMDGEHLHADILRAFGEFRGIEALFIPAETHFHGYGGVCWLDGAHRGVHDLRCEV